MIQNYNIRTSDMPQDMRVLFNQYPRESWEAHPGFKEKTKNWLGAHQMFRKLGSVILDDSEDFLDKKQDDERYISRLAYYGDALVRNLHGHHHFEDHSYFPELKAADARFARGLEILEQDHQDLDRVLEAFTESANRAIKLYQLDRGAIYDEVAQVYETSRTIGAFLDRHLSDEEELAVPIILHHRLRG